MPNADVFYANAVIAREVPVEPPPEGARADAQGWLALEAPPPFGTILRLEPEGRFVRVVEVWEKTAGHGGRAGVGIAPAADEEVRAARTLPTTELAPLAPTPPNDATAPDGSDVPDAPTGYAVPAPVLEPEPSEAVDVAAAGAPAPDDGAAQDAHPRGSGPKRRKGRRRS